MDIYWGDASAGANATNPKRFKFFVMSILLTQQKQILILEKKLGIKQQ
jgi:hypothetical protein